jgi:hypothetical protein
MPALLTHTPCPSCGTRHHFACLEDHLEPGQDYYYVCPVTGMSASLRPAATAEVVRSWPQGAVELMPRQADLKASATT